MCRDEWECLFYIWFFALMFLFFNHWQSHLLSQSHDNRSLNKLRYIQRIQKDRVSACAVGLIAIHNLKKGKDEKDWYDTDDRPR